jgi:hypothetical protein
MWGFQPQNELLGRGNGVYVEMPGRETLADEGIVSAWSILDEPGVRRRCLPRRASIHFSAVQTDDNYQHAWNTVALQLAKLPSCVRVLPTSRGDPHDH